MADPLRRTLSKLRGRRARRSPECDREGKPAPRGHSMKDCREGGDSDWGERAGAMGGLCDWGERTGAMGGLCDWGERTGAMGGLCDWGERTGAMGGLCDWGERTGAMGGLCDWGERAGAMGGLCDWGERAGAMGGLCDWGERAGAMGGLCDWGERAGAMGGLCDWGERAGATASVSDSEYRTGGVSEESYGAGVADGLDYGAGVADGLGNRGYGAGVADGLGNRGYGAGVADGLGNQGYGAGVADGLGNQGYGAGVADGLGYGAGVADGLGYGAGVADGLGYGAGVADGLGYGAGVARRCRPPVNVSEVGVRWTEQCNNENRWGVHVGAAEVSGSFLGAWAGENYNNNHSQFVGARNGETGHVPISYRGHSGYFSSCSPSSPQPCGYLCHEPCAQVSVPRRCPSSLDTQSPDMQGHRVHSPFSALTFVFPSQSQTMGPQEPGSWVPASCTPGVLGEHRFARPSPFHLFSSDYPELAGGTNSVILQDMSEDSEEEDYYDNGTLLVDAQSNNMGPIPSLVVADTYQERPERVNLYLETDRLRWQLQEAYYLLIHTMHDMPLCRRASPPSGSQDSMASQSTARTPRSDSSCSDAPLCHGELGPLQTRERNYVNRLRSNSLDSLATMSCPDRETLRRWHSDSLLKQCWLPLHLECGIAPTEQRASPQTNRYPVTCAHSLSVAEEPSACSGESSAESEHHKQPGLTVRKMQKWMCKGRLLSLEMKERITGSSKRTTGPCTVVPRGTNRSSSCGPRIGLDLAPEMSGEMARPPLTEFIENVFVSSVLGRDIKVTAVNEHNLQRNLITVSKKRNWLTQSTYRLPNPTSFGTNQAPGALVVHKEETSPLILNVGTESLSQSHNLSPESPAGPGPWEDNDAHTEGEIWYNPIPEDDDPYPCDKTDPAPPSCESLPGNSIHSSECGPRTSSKPQMGQAQEVPLSPRPSNAGSGFPSPNKASPAALGEFSPPSSPNPAKKGGNISWSLPDKIKSPRTVRKLSMKMKKLPELSRKLSVRGTSSNVTSDHTVSSMFRGHCQHISRTPSLSSAGSSAAASRNVISRYHLDSSVMSQQSDRRKRSSSSKSSSKGGYLSDGDSPELVTKSSQHGCDGRPAKGKELLPGSNVKNDIDVDAFRHYSSFDQPKCFHYVSGLMSAHFYGAEDLKPPRIDSKDVFCAIQVDSVNKARTALLTCRTTFLDMDHTFNIELENAQHLKLVVFSWDPAPRKNRVCCHGTVVLPALFRVIKTHQLAVKLEPRGLIYVKLTLMEQWDNSLERLVTNREPVLFGVEARKVVEKENMGLKVPLLMDKCIREIEKRGCQVVGLYRLCGSAAVKKELREAFEKDSKAVGLCEDEYPDINVITGVLKDYLRELPSPLITKQLYEAVLAAMAAKPLKMTTSGCENNACDSEEAVGLLDCLPEVEQATLKMLLDHLKLVASHHEVNKMTCQNLAVCFGPVLLSQRQETSAHNNRVFIDSDELASALDFKKHIEVLHYLLQLWPVKSASTKEPAPTSDRKPCLRRKKPRPQMLNLSGSDLSGVLRPRVARLDSPSSNRYAGDWSSCRETYFTTGKAKTGCPGVATETGADIAQQQLIGMEQAVTAFQSLQLGEDCEDQGVNLHDLQESIDTLLGNLEQELNKTKLNNNG
uniref:Synapse defective Rho GTPase homolog 2 n=1 Tax=Leptobrachium leishanense TaxID=445787 RepID=A0A8C5WDS7_9ANUR